MQPLARLVAAAEANKAAQAAAAAKRAKLGHELRLAAISGDDVEAKRLLDAGAPVAALDEIDNCPLSYAATYGHAEVAELLVERGATVKKWHYDKVFPLMDAASGGCSGIIELFINHGADVNETDKEGLTPLHQAAMEGHREAVEVLLKFGADPTRRTKSRREYGQAKMGPGRTPEESARFCGHNQTALFLRHYIEATATAPLKDGNGEDTSQLRRVGHPSIDVVSASGPLRTGDTFALHLGQRRGADITMDFVWVPPGTFVMGSPRDEKGREEYDNEGPQHRVTITQGFWMAACPVTQQQYRLVTGSDPRYTHFGPGLHELPDHPLEHVPWNEASIFCDILNASKRFRGQLRGSEASLPTEAEWEYACRAGTTTPFYSGTTEQELADVGWYVRNSECETHPVGEKTPNAWGLYDMHGNVWEWCHDFYGEYSARNMTDPSGPASDESHVIRGGSYAEGFLGTRSASRRAKECDSFYNDPIGFRICLRLDNAPPHVSHGNETKQGAPPNMQKSDAPKPCPPPLPPQANTGPEREPSSHSSKTHAPSETEAPTTQPVRFSCPHCGQHLAAPPEMAGHDISCPKCEGSVRIPEPTEDSGVGPTSTE